MVRLTDLAIYRKARALGTWWDSMVRQQEASADVPPPVADELVDLIHDLHRAWEPARRPEPTDDPVLNDLLAKHQEMNAMATTAPYVAVPTSLPRVAQARHTGSREGTETLRRVDLPTSLGNRLPAVLAATLLIILIGATAARLWLDGNGSGPRSGGPIVYAPATPSPDATPTDETLFEISIPAEFLPTGENISVEFARLAVPAGTISEWTTDCCSGPLVEYVLSGAYTVRAHDPITVIRANGHTEAIPGGTEVTLGVGDGLLSHNENQVEASNTGSDPAILLQWVMIDNLIHFNGHQLPGWEFLQGPDGVRTFSLENTPAQIELRRVTSPAGKVIETRSDSTHVQVALFAEADSDGRVSRASDGSIIPYTPSGEAATVYIVSFSQAEATFGTPGS